MPQKSFGRLIRDKRESKGIGLREFALQLRVSPTYVSLVEQDKCSLPTEGRVRQMALILDENPDELLAQAGRVAKDLPDIIRKHPREMASFLRTADGLGPDDIRRLSDKARKMKES
jgi:transcriptional regulator with XRE-family HTH domain